MQRSEFMQGPEISPVQPKQRLWNRFLTFLPDGITVCGVWSLADGGGAQPQALTIGILIALDATSLTLQPLLTPNRSKQKHAYIKNTVQNKSVSKVTTRQ